MVGDHIQKTKSYKLLINYFYLKVILDSKKAREDSLLKLEFFEKEFDRIERLLGGNLTQEDLSINLYEEKERSIELKKKIYEINESLTKENSNIASNRLVINKNPMSFDFKKYVSARYLSENRSTLFKKFSSTDEISKTTFYRYSNVDNLFKKPHRYDYFKQIILKII